MNRIHSSYLLCSVISLCILFCCGCGQSDTGLYIVKGKVTHKGKGVAKLYLMFRPTDLMKAAESTALTDQDGNFEMSVGSTPGVFPGEHTVSAQDPWKADGRQVSTEPEYLEVVEKYSPENSQYKVEIRKDTYDLEIKFD